MHLFIIHGICRRSLLFTPKHCSRGICYLEFIRILISHYMHFCICRAHGPVLLIQKLPRSCPEATQKLLKNYISMFWALLLRLAECQIHAHTVSILPYTRRTLLWTLGAWSWFTSVAYTHVGSSLFVDGKWVDSVEGHTIESVPCFVASLRN